MIYFNKEKLRDKIHACWIGKNIGGTMGAPYEGRQELNDINGFATPKGKPLPNDDLDLQLVWLKAAMERGPQAINSKVLAEYWMSFIGPNWNEYGVSKANMRAGIVPPLSGSFYNDQWKHSNGAWIRTEIWACMNPGCPERAIKLAFEDGSVDHGFGEGSYAAIFVAAMESAAFVINDIRKLIDIALSKIPEDSRLAGSVKIALAAFDEGVDWKTARERVIDYSKDLGWFQAPANVAFVIIGLLYGKCDFKQSMIIAINCGDDTDCTGATVGALLGIMKGTAGIPDDWREYIGEEIITGSIITGLTFFPNHCSQVTDCVMALIPASTLPNMRDMCVDGYSVVIHDEEDDFSKLSIESFYGNEFVTRTFDCGEHCLIAEGNFAKAIVEFAKEPVIEACGELDVKVTVKTSKEFSKQDHYELIWHLPEGWSVSGRCNLFANPINSPYKSNATSELKICAGEKISTHNHIVLEVRRVDYPMPIFIPIVVMG